MSFWGGCQHLPLHALVTPRGLDLFGAAGDAAAIGPYQVGGGGLNCRATAWCGARLHVEIGKACRGILRHAAEGATLFWILESTYNFPTPPPAESKPVPPRREAMVGTGHAPNGGWERTPVHTRFWPRIVTHTNTHLTPPRRSLCAQFYSFSRVLSRCQAGPKAYGFRG